MKTSKCNISAAMPKSWDLCSLNEKMFSSRLMILNVKIRKEMASEYILTIFVKHWSHYSLLD